MRNKKMIRALAAMLAAILAAGCAAGCGKKYDASGVKGENKEMTVFMHFFNYCVYNDNWPIFEKAAEATGVHLKGTASETVSDSSQAYNTMLASKKLPDIIHSSSGNLNKIGKEGALIPLEDLIDKYAPNIKELMEKYPRFKRKATADDGHIYYIPGSISGLDVAALPSTGWFIRNDWLDKLGLKQPKTVEELVEVWTAFRNKDPNGNGVKDEIPFFARVDGLNPLFNLFDTQQSGYEARDGKVTYAPSTDRFKTAVKEIAKWYSAGLIDEEIFTRGNSAREQLLGGNTGGSCHDWFSSTGAFSAQYADKIPGIDFSAIAPPANINGDVVERSSRAPLHNYGWGISKDNSDPERTMKYFDFWFTPEGTDLISYGVEGEHYNIVDGKKVLTDEVLKAEDGAPTYMRRQGQVEIGAVRDFEAEYQAMGDAAKKGFELYRENGYCLPVTEFAEFTENENAVKEKYASDINTFANEQLQKWVMGTESVDATWDKYISTLNSMHLSEMVDIYQSAYDRANK